MSAVAAAVVVGATTIYASNKASSAAKAASASQAQAAAGLADSADYAADLTYKLGNEQLSFAKQQYSDMKPLADRIATSQVAAQEEQMRQARDYYDYNVKTFRPLEQGLVRDAENFNTEAYRTQMAQRAAADVQQAFQGAQSQSNREMARRGINPNSAAAISNINSNALRLASATAGAQTNARSQAEQMGYARRLEVTGLGRGLTGAANAAYSGATNAGTAGINTAMAPGNQYTSAATPAFNTMVAGAGQQVNAYSALYSGATSSANAARANEMGLYGSIIGMGGTLVSRGAATGKFG